MDQLWLTNGLKEQEGCGERDHNSEVTGHELEEKKEKGLKGKLI